MSRLWGLRKNLGIFTCAAAGLIIGASGAIAGEADVVAASARATGERVYTFSATVRHADAGWDHYADRWQVLTPDGTVLGERVLLHPHDSEQPFTRSLSGVAIPPEIEVVTIRAGDSVHDFGGAEICITLSEDGGEGAACLNQ